MVRKLHKTWPKITWPVYVVAALLCLVGVGASHLAIARADSVQASNASGAVQAIWPTNNVGLTGKTAFLASVSGVPGSQYEMFWYVDSGPWNWMGDSKNDADIKQADADLSGWHWHSNNTYVITFVAVMHGSGQRSYTSASIHLTNTASTSTPPLSPPTATATPKAAPTTAAAASSAPLPARTTGQLPLYVDPSNVVSQNLPGVSDPNSRRILTRLSQQPMANWYGNWDSNITGDVASYVSAAAAVNQMPVLVAYNIPQRDCGGYSAGGSNSNSSYLSWVQNFASGIGSRPALVLLEPDALAQMDCLSSGDQANRLSLISSSVAILKANPRTRVYIDAGHPAWKSASDMAARLKAANIASADGFSLNVSNYIATDDNLSYGKQISDALGGKHFVIDTGRNGNGANGEWCNPSGRALGALPTFNTGDTLADAYLWVKAPGGSDGQCNSGGDAGSWSASQALTLAQDAGW